LVKRNPLQEEARRRLSGRMVQDRDACSLTTPDSTKPRLNQASWIMRPNATVGALAIPLGWKESGDGLAVTRMRPVGTQLLESRYGATHERPGCGKCLPSESPSFVSLSSWSEAQRSEAELRPALICFPYALVERLATHGLASTVSLKEVLVLQRPV
jgi:hypothetical protein